MRVRPKSICSALLISAFFAYVGILIQGRSERNSVVDTVVCAGRLAADGTDALNTAFDASNGSAAIGLNYRFRSFARWAIEPPDSIARARQPQPNETRWLYVMAEAPEFFSADGYARVYVGNTLVGEIRSLPAKAGSTFAADPTPQSIRIPPGRTFGYRFALGDDRRCSGSACTLSIRGSWTFWHVYRFAVVEERPRFVAVRLR